MAGARALWAANGMKKEMQGKLQEIFEWFHRNPELSYEEYRTTEHIRQILTDAGIEILPLPLETGLAAYIAHPDITAIRCERWTPDLKAAYEDILKASPALDIPLEINAYGLRKPPVDTPEGKRPPYPWLPFWELAAEYGVKTVAGADAHRPEDVWGNIEDAFAIAEKFGLEICNADVARKILAQR